MNEIILAIKLAKLLQYCLVNSKQNPYTIPEVKAGYLVLAKLTKYSGDWMDMDLNETIFQLENKLD